MSRCSASNLLNSTEPLYTFQPLIADKNSFEVTSTWFTILNLVLGLYIVLANTFVVKFYGGKMKQVVPLVYTFIASNDILTGNLYLFYFSGLVADIVFNYTIYVY